MDSMKIHGVLSSHFLRDSYATDVHSIRMYDSLWQELFPLRQDFEAPWDSVDKVLCVS